MIIAVVRPAGENKLLQSRSLAAVTSAGEKQTKIRYADEQVPRS